ncbi:MAG: superoxide dismutase [Candidatus Verstraetearchaeota archaeon]|nr:superoxide dismutase [Candidatus Verstraetearchaeota archaeon]
MEKRFYSLPPLPYEYKALAPYISEEQLRIHHSKHHQAYVDNANAILRKLDDAATSGSEVDIKSLCKELSFNLGGHLLHSRFWETLAPPGEVGKEPSGHLADAISRDFGGLEKFKRQFSQAAMSVEGSGWAVLTYCFELDRLMIMQIEKHNVNVIAGFPLVMDLDVWEHAYYIDYRNARAKFVEAFWSVVNWDGVSDWFSEVRS